MTQSIKVGADKLWSWVRWAMIVFLIPAVMWAIDVREDIVRIDQYHTQVVQPFIKAGDRFTTKDAVGLRSDILLEIKASMQRHVGDGPHENVAERLSKIEANQSEILRALGRLEANGRK